MHVTGIQCCVCDFVVMMLGLLAVRVGGGYYKIYSPFFNH